MNILHLITVNLRLQPELLAQIQASTAAGDAVLLLGSGIYGADIATQLPARLYVLQADTEASGYRPADCESIDHACMVTLCERHERSLTWN